MKRRVVAAIVAAVLAIVGGGLVLAYAGGAEARARAGQEMVNVFIVVKTISQGTAVSALDDSIERRELPRVAVVKDAVTDLAVLKGKVAAVDLVAGEQLITSRFVAPSAVRPDEGVKVPAGMEEVSIQLEAQRTVGAQLKAGNTVGVVLAVPEPNEAHQVASKVLVTRVQVVSSESDASASPTVSLIVTLAVKPELGERIIWAQAFGSVWLTLQNDDTDTTSVDGVDREKVLT